LSGHVVITITNLTGTASNAVLSGLFLDPAASLPPPTSASLVKRDTATQGNWIGSYGAQGYNVLGNAVSYPAYATVTPAGQTSFTWAASTADTRALRTASGSDRIAACWYTFTSFTI